jgi:protocatechuate 3,4-dioxygenase beta subunit
MKSIPFATALHQAAVNRRRFLSRLAMGASPFAVPGAFAEALTHTPKQTEGPFYPDKLPLDTDNDLLLLNDAATPAIGEITWLQGRILNHNGTPIPGAVIEIWQCDANGVYLHSRSGKGTAPRDTNFQGFGRFLTGRSGEYVFRTIKPVPYTGRTPHIHVKVKDSKGKELLTTQCYVKGFAQNERDGIWKRLDEKQRESVTVNFAPIPNSKTGELLANFDIVLGFTPDES